LQLRYLGSQEQLLCVCASNIFYHPDLDGRISYTYTHTNKRASSKSLASSSLTTHFGARKTFDTQTNTLAQFLKLEPVYDLNRFT